MKVVFLDIDGVLLSHRTLLAHGTWAHDPEELAKGEVDEVSLSMIRKIVGKADASIVLSSSWRILNSWHDMGEALKLPIMGQTPVGSPNGSARGNEIADWLRDRVDVTHYAIIDDDSDMLEHQKPYFVHTSGFNGFSWENATKLASVLGIDVHDAIRWKEES